MCYGLSRLLGLVGLIGGGEVVFAIARSSFHMILEKQSLRELSPRETVISVAVVLVGFVCSYVSRTVGYLIKVSNDRLSAAIDGFWHFGANAVVVWLPVMGT